MSHNHNYEPMPSWVIWAGVGMMVFTVLVFVLFTLGQIYWG
jgi:uncharacterized membrane protein YidH (DUF202 family)